MYRFILLAILTAFAGVPSAVHAQQTDTTHHMAPGMKMPGEAKKPASTTKTAAPKKRTTAPTKSARPTHPATDSARMKMPDSAHMQMPVHDTTHMQMPAHDTAHMPMRDTSHVAAHDTMSMAAMDTMPMAMAMEGPLGISMERMGSGTTWIPDAVMLPSRHVMLGGWTVMLHGFVFGQYDHQSGARGDEQWGSLNWAMVMADRMVGGGRLQFRFMPSVDAATVGKCGYPLLLQSGETCNGQPLVDRQHPHDFFMELGALYERAITSSTAVLLYASPAGEPALGPVAFMHRPSAMDVPSAPLSHHWQDATHISFGVITTGVYTRRLRLEASAFNGLEPDENRWDFDPIRINSYSTRLTVNPSANWSFTAGYGSISEPEPSNPDGLLHRVVGSAMYGRKLGEDGQWATTVVYGANKQDAWTGSGLLESEAVLDRHNTVLGRIEVIQKTASDLVLPAFSGDRVFNVGSAMAGYIRELARGRDVTIGLGATATVNYVPAAIESDYGSRTPLGLMVFLRLRPYHSPHSSSMSGMHQPHEH